MKTLIAFLLLTTSAYAGSSIINLTGSNNIITSNQIGDTSVSLNATNLNNSSVSFDQQGGGNHSANIELYGHYENYSISVTQNSASDKSISVQQYCGVSSCTPYPMTVNQY